MDQLLKFLYAYRVIVAFVALEILCGAMLVSNNEYVAESYFSSLHSITAPVLQQKKRLTDYFNLNQTNKRLTEENIALRNEIERYKGQTIVASPFALDNRYLAAEVVGNTVNQTHNYITLNKGISQGVQEGMGVINMVGVVGKIKYVSKNYAVAISLLNVNFQVSSMIKQGGYAGAVQWAGDNPKIVKLLHIPRHVLPAKGDTVLTSGHNAVFPKGVAIGAIQKVDLPAESMFFDIDVALFQNFSAIDNVAVILNKDRQEFDSLAREVIKRNQ